MNLVMKQLSVLLSPKPQEDLIIHIFQSSYEKNLPKMAEALAHGADVNWSNSEENKATPLIQAVLGV